MSPTSRYPAKPFVRCLFAMLVIVFGWIGLAQEARADMGHLGETVIPPNASLDAVMCTDAVAAACVINVAKSNSSPAIIPGSGMTKLDLALDVCKGMYLSLL